MKFKVNLKNGHSSEQINKINNTFKCLKEVKILSLLNKN